MGPGTKYWFGALDDVIYVISPRPPFGTPTLWNAVSLHFEGNNYCSNPTAVRYVTVFNLRYAKIVKLKRFKGSLSSRWPGASCPPAPPLGHPGLIYSSCFDSYLEFSKMSLFFEICFILYFLKLSAGSGFYNVTNVRHWLSSIILNSENMYVSVSVPPTDIRQNTTILLFQGLESLGSPGSTKFFFYLWDHNNLMFLCYSGAFFCVRSCTKLLYIMLILFCLNRSHGINILTLTLDDFADERSPLDREMFNQLG